MELEPAMELEASIQTDNTQAALKSFPKALPAVEVGPTEDHELENLKKKYGLLSARDIIEQGAKQEVGGSYLVSGMIREGSVNVLVGDSGLGKTPFGYQLGLCIAAGVPFLGYAVERGRVLLLDYENAEDDSHWIIKQQCSFLGLREPPQGLLVWSFSRSLNHGDPHCQGEKADIRMIEAMKPVLTIIDSARSYKPDFEQDNHRAAEAIKELRQVSRECGTAFLLLHHVRKHSAEKDPGTLEDVNILMTWLEKAAGARAIINQTDTRLAVDVASGRSVRGQEAALILRGYARVRGEIGPIYLTRKLDDTGEPLGYERMRGVELLFNPDQKKAYQELPASFAFKDAKQLYNREDQPTRDFLKKCIAHGILSQPARGQYEKGQ